MLNKLFKCSTGIRQAAILAIPLLPAVLCQQGVTKNKNCNMSTETNIPESNLNNVYSFFEYRLLFSSNNCECGFSNELLSTIDNDIKFPIAGCVKSIYWVSST